jgi:DeoR/GlpR family transcriptional regulator of sugar metabolism
VTRPESEPESAPGSSPEIGREPDRPRLPAQARLAAIVKRLNVTGSVTVAEVVRDFGVSDMTARRDLSELERGGLLERVHGGAVLPSPPHPAPAVDAVEPSFGARALRNASAKERIAREAARIVMRHRTIAMDVGTTTQLVAQNLDGLARARIFTNSLRIADALSQSPNEIYMPGGRVRPDEMSIMGPMAVEQFGKLFFDIAVIGISGLTTGGLFDFSLEDAELKRVYIERSGLSLVLCDSSKFQRMSLVRICDLGAVDMVLTDADPPAPVATALAAAGVELRVAG